MPMKYSICGLCELTTYFTEILDCIQLDFILVILNLSLNCYVWLVTTMGFPSNSVVTENAGDTCSIPGSGRCPGGGHGNPLQYSCLENPMDRGAWWATVHGVSESWIRLRPLSTASQSHYHIDWHLSKQRLWCSRRIWNTIHTFPQDRLKSTAWQKYSSQISKAPIQSSAFPLW